MLLTMSSRLGAFVASLMAAIVVVLPSPTTPQAMAAVQSTTQAIYAYDVQLNSAISSDTAAERGPSADDDQGTFYDAVDHWSPGAAARPDGATPSAANDYDHSVLVVQDASTTNVARERGQAGGGDLGAHSGASVAANKGDDVVRALSATERRTLDDALRPDKLDHVFDPKHNFGPLVQRFGSRENAMEQIVRNIGGPLPASGPFRVARSIGGQTVIIRGAVVDGTPRIGTAFTP